MLARCAHRLCRQVNPRVVRALHREHRTVGAIAAADLEHALAVRSMKLGEVRNMPFGAIAEGAVFAEKISSVRERCDEMGAASFGIPEGLHAQQVGLGVQAIPLRSLALALRHTYPKGVVRREKLRHLIAPLEL